MTARVTFATDSSGTDHPLQANSAETELTATEIEMLTMDFLFADVAAKSTGPSGAQARSTLSFVKNVLTVRDKLWASAHLKPRVKARLADEKGRLDKEELLGYICNNALGRPLLPEGAARDVGQAANNALKKEERLTAEAKAKHSVAISKARAAAKQDPMLVATILEAEEARDAEFKAILAEDYDLQLPNATVGAKRKRPSAPAPVDHVALLPRAERACREARQALEEAELHRRQLGSQPLIKDLANDDAAQAAAEREWIRGLEMRHEAQKAWWLAKFLHDRLNRQFHKTRMAACVARGGATGRAGAGGG